MTFIHKNVSFLFSHADAIQAAISAVVEKWILPLRVILDELNESFVSKDPHKFDDSIAKLTAYNQHIKVYANDPDNSIEIGGVSMNVRQLARAYLTGCCIHRIYAPYGEYITQDDFYFAAVASALGIDQYVPDNLDDVFAFFSKAIQRYPKIIGLLQENDTSLIKQKFVDIMRDKSKCLQVWYLIYPIIITALNPFPGLTNKENTSDDQDINDYTAEFWLNDSRAHKVLNDVFVNMAPGMNEKTLDMAPDEKNIINLISMIHGFIPDHVEAFLPNVKSILPNRDVGKKGALSGGIDVNALLSMVSKLNIPQ